MVWQGFVWICWLDMARSNFFHALYRDMFTHFTDHVAGRLLDQPVYVHLPTYLIIRYQTLQFLLF